MGYESKVYIVQESKHQRADRLPWGDVIAMFDLCKMNYWDYYGRSFPLLFDQERTCEFYADDGNTIITKDNYGDSITKANNATVIKWMKRFVKENDWYRANALLATLLALEKNNVEYSLYHYGC